MNRFAAYLVVNATTLLTMRSWRFTRDGLGDSRIGHATWNGSPVGIGKAVGASAAFPPARIELNPYQFTEQLPAGRAGSSLREARNNCSDPQSRSEERHKRARTTGRRV